MTETQMVHIASINSYNIITKKVSLDKIVKSDLIMFAHDVRQEVDSTQIEFLIEYFKYLEMYEHCADLKKALEGLPPDIDCVLWCDCEYPGIGDYEPEMFCTKCNGKINDGYY